MAHNITRITTHSRASVNETTTGKFGREAVASIDLEGDTEYLSEVLPAIKDMLEMSRLQILDDLTKHMEESKNLWPTSQ